MNRIHSLAAPAACLLLAAFDLGAQTEPRTPEAILQEAATAYAAIQSYSDSGTVVYRKPDGSERLTVAFHVWFERPAHFRIDAESRAPGREKGRREVMWSDGAAARTWASDKPVASHAKVKLVGSGMFGAYAYHVPTLLEATYGGHRRLNDLKAPSLIGEEKLGEIDCYRIKGDWEGDTYEVWIGKGDLLVRKIAAKYSDHTLEEVHREITLNQPIPREVFHFAPENEVLPPPKTKK